MDTSTITQALAGGLLIGLGAAALMFLSGRIAGLSGIVSGLVSPKPGDFGWRLSFALGIVAGGALLFAFRPDLFTIGVTRSLPAFAFAGLLVGFGARLGSGCTSGHGVCGLARMGPRSMVATATFMASGALAAFLVNHLLGGAI